MHFGQTKKWRHEYGFALNRHKGLAATSRSIFAALAIRRGMGRDFQ
jgi:hypothetical protein